MALKKDWKFPNIPPLPDRISNTTELRAFVHTVTCFDDSREVARKVDEWLRGIMRQIKERPCPQGSYVPEKKPCARGKPTMKRNQKCSKGAGGKGEPERTQSFIARHADVCNKMPKGFQPLLDKIMRELWLVKPTKIMEYLADFLEAELTRNLVEEHVKNLALCKSKKATRAEQRIDNDAAVSSDMPTTAKAAKPDYSTQAHSSSSYYREMFMTSLINLVDVGHVEGGQSSKCYIDMFLKSLTDLHAQESIPIPKLTEAEVAEKASEYFREMFMTSLIDLANSRSGFKATSQLNEEDTAADVEPPTPLPAPDSPDDFYVVEQPSVEPLRDVEDVYDDTEEAADYALVSPLDMLPNVSGYGATPAVTPQHEDVEVEEEHEDVEEEKHEDDEEEGKHEDSEKEEKHEDEEEETEEVPEETRQEESHEEDKPGVVSAVSYITPEPDEVVL